MRIVALGLLCAWLAIAAHTPARGQWQRIVLSGKGEFDDIASPHPLSYFTRNSFLRDDSNEFCISCTPDDKAGSGRKYSVRTAINPVGTLADFPVVDLLYSITARNQPSGYKVTWKSILVQVSRDSYREIFHLQAFYTTASLKPSRIIQSGNEKILATVDSDGGNAGNCWEHYWWFDRSGPHSLNFSRLGAAISDQVPKNAVFTISCSTLDFESSQVHDWVQKADARCHACDYVGEVTARFRLDGFVVVPVAISFKPGDPNSQRDRH